MIIATLKEIKDNENRVGLTPEGAKELTSAGHKVIIQKNAGQGAGFLDEEYQNAGAEMMENPAEIVKIANMVIKIKEPLPSEYPLLDEMKGKTLFTYLHLSGVDPRLTDKLIENQITGIGYETVEDKKGRLPLLSPMSEIAGVLAVQYAAEYLQKKYHGRGITMGTINNTEPAKVVIVGAGVVGTKAAKTAGAMGSKVKLFDINEVALERSKKEIKKLIGNKLLNNIEFIKTEQTIFESALKETDVLIGGVLLKGAKAPVVVSEQQIKMMKNGAVVVDVAIDQGGCIWGSKATTHSNPIYEIDGKIFCCVANMPGQVARQSTQALTSATLPYIIQMAKKGVVKALCKSDRFAQGLNTYKGNITYQSVAKDLKLEQLYKSLTEIGVC